MSENARLTGLVGNAAIKVPCRVATTAAITLSGEQTIDGVACVTDDRVLVKNQASSIDNGIYVVDTGDWERSKDSDGSYDVVYGTLVNVNSGAANSGFWYQSTSGTITMGTSANTWGMASSTLAVISAFVQTLLDDTTSNAFLTTLTATRSEAGAVAVPVLNKLREIVSPEDFGAVGDGTTDDITAINAALQASTFVRFTPNKTYLISSYLVPKAFTYIDARGSKVKLKNASNTHMFRVPTGVNDWTVEGGDWDGNKANQTTGGNGFTNAASSTVLRGRLLNLTVHDCYDHGIGWAGTVSKYIIESGIIAYSNGASGVGSVSGIQQSVVTGSIAYSNGTSNFGGSGIAEYLAYAGCVGEAAGTADNFTGYGAGTKFVAGAALVSKGGSNNGLHVSGDYVTFSSVAIDSPTQYGFVSRVNSDGLTVANGSAFAAITVKDAGASSFWFDNNDAFAGAALVGVSPVAHNLYLDTTNTNGHFTGVFKEAGADNVRLQTATDIVVSATGVDGVSDGAQITNSTGVVLSGRFTGNAAGINESGTSNTNVFSHYSATSNTSDTPAFVGAASTVDMSLPGGTSTITAASTIAIPHNKRHVVITGGTAIDNITARPTGTRVVIRSDGNNTINDGGNLKLTGNLSLTDLDCVDLVCDGTNWYQEAPVAAN